MAVGTNSAASDVMRRAGADRVATGENPVIVACRSAQIIVGPIGIVIADSRAPRDGKFTEKIGVYNPNTNPATVDLNFDRALYWLEVGAQPTDTVKNILSREGVLLMKHLRVGVKRGAFDEATCQKRFDEWKQAKTAGTEAFAKKLADDKKAAAQKALEEEKKTNEAIAQKVAEKKAAAAAAAKKRAEELARKKAAAEAAARENARRIAEAKAREAAAEAARRKAAEEARLAAEAARKAQEEAAAQAEAKAKAKAQARARAAAEAAKRAAAEQAAREAAAEQAARKAEAERRAAELKAKMDAERSTREIAAAKKEAQEASTLSSVDRMLSGGFEANRGRLPMPISGSYRVVSHFGQYHVEGLKGVTLDNKGINIQGKPGCVARSIYDGEVSAVFGYGGMWNVLVRHGAYISVYCNLKSVSVHKGQKVSTRQALGSVGSDNILQFQLRKETAKLNPEAWLGR